MSLAEFLLARFAEEEAAARKDEPWLWTDDENRPVPDADLALVVGSDLRMEVPVRRWLADVEAKRRVVAECVDVLEWDARTGKSGTADLPSFAELILQALAMPYAEHPDFDEGWRV